MWLELKPLISFIDLLLNNPCTLIWVFAEANVWGQHKYMFFICKRHTICKLLVAIFIACSWVKRQLINKLHCNNQRDQSPFIHMHVIIWSWTTPTHNRTLQANPYQSHLSTWWQGKTTLRTPQLLVSVGRQCKLGAVAQIAGQLPPFEFSPGWSFECKELS